MDEWEFIFDFRVREVVKDQLTLVDMGLLFFLAKNITNKEFMENTQPELYKDFLYKDLSKIKFFYVKERQIGRLIDKLVNASYIKTQKIFGGVSVALTFKYFNSISPKQFNEPDNQKYFFLLKWSKMSKLAFETGQKCQSFYTYYLSNTKNNNIYNNINNLNTEEDIIDNSNNINKEKLLLPLFEKYSQFKTNLLDDLKLPKDFNCHKLIQAVDNSYFLRNKIGIKFLIKHYDYALRGDYKGEDKEDKSKLIVKDSKDIGIQQIVFDQEEYSISPDMREKLKNIEKEQEQLLLQLREQAINKLRENNKFYIFDDLSEAEQEELIEIFVQEQILKRSQTE